jgi:hypothetical protein
MVLQVTLLSNTNEEQSPMKADRRLWLTRDRETVVEDGAIEAVLLLAAAGRSIPGGEVVRLRLMTDADGRVSQAPVEAPVADPAPEVKEQSKPEDKQRAKPADKSAKKPATKRRSKRRK